MFFKVLRGKRIEENVGQAHGVKGTGGSGYGSLPKGSVPGMMSHLMAGELVVKTYAWVLRQTFHWSHRV